MDREGQSPGELNSPEMKELERELRALVPRAPNVELAKVMYLAGQASLSPVPPSPPAPPAAGWNAQWLWPISTAIAATAAAWLGVLLFLANHRHALETPAPPRVIVQPHAPATLPPQQAEPSVAAIEAPAPAVAAQDAHYLRARETALSAGVDALTDEARSQPSATDQTIDRAHKRRVERELGIRRPLRAGWNPFGF